jgi:hypothetical protein
MQKEQQILIVINNPKMLKNLENKIRYGPKLCTEKYLKQRHQLNPTTGQFSLPSAQLQLSCH